MSDPRVIAHMKAKYPERKRPLPAFVTKGQPVENLRGLRDSLLELETGNSAGTGGLRSEYLNVLEELMSEEQRELLESFGMRYLSGELPPCPPPHKIQWFYKQLDQLGSEIHC